MHELFREIQLQIAFNPGRADMSLIRDNIELDNLNYWHKAIMEDLTMGEMDVNEYCVQSTKLNNLITETKGRINSILCTN